MKWITNTPKKVTLDNVVCNINETAQEALDNYNEWRIQYIEGLPKATDKYTVVELITMDMIGLYK